MTNLPLQDTLNHAKSMSSQTREDVPMEQRLRIVPWPRFGTSLFCWVIGCFFQSVNTNHLYSVRQNPVDLVCWDGNRNRTFLGASLERFQQSSQETQNYWQQVRGTNQQQQMCGATIGCTLLQAWNQSKFKMVQKSSDNQPSHHLQLSKPVISSSRSLVFKDAMTKLRWLLQ